MEVLNFNEGTHVFLLEDNEIGIKLKTFKFHQF